MVARLGHVICVSQWDVSKYSTSHGLSSPRPAAQSERSLARLLDIVRPLEKNAGGQKPIVLSSLVHSQLGAATGVSQCHGTEKPTS